MWNIPRIKQSKEQSQRGGCGLCYCICTLIEIITKPSIYVEATQVPGWCDAMEQDIHAIHKNQAWQLMDFPPREKLIIIKWVYKVKTHANGTTTKLKARLVARGFQQQAGEDFE